MYKKGNKVNIQFKKGEKGRKIYSQRSQLIVQ